MFFDDTLLNKAIKDINIEDKTSEPGKFYLDLINKLYIIIFHFNSETDSLFYECLAKDPNTIHTSIDYIYLKISFFDLNSYMYENALTHPYETILAYYINSIDKAKSKGEISYYDRKYHFIPENLRRLATCSKIEKQDFIDARQDFINLLNVIEKNDLINTNVKDDNVFNDYLKTKPKEIIKIIKDGTYEFDENFDQQDITKHIQVNTNEQLYQELYAIRGQKLIINGNVYKVAPEVYHGSINTDEFNKLVFTPSLRFIQQKRFFFDKKKSFIEVNILRNIIRLITFETTTAALFYSYFIQNPILKIDYVKDLLESKFGDDFTKIFVPIKTQDVFSHYLFIDYFVNLKRTNTLEFKTVFRLNNKFYSREDLMKNYYYRNVILSFEDALAKLNLPANSTHSNIDVLDFLTLDLSLLRKMTNIILDDSIIEKQITTNPDIQFVAKKNEDWFELDIISKRYSDSEIDLIFKSLKEKKNYVIIDDDIIYLNHLENKKDLVEIYNFKNKFDSKFPMYELFRLESIKDHSNIDITYDEYVKKVLYEIKNYKNLEIELPKQFKENLRPYQYEAVKWMTVLSRNGLAGILADDMGLGKTLETIAYLETLTENEPVLIVCPKSVTYNWLYEFNKWNSSYTPVVIEGLKEERDDIINNISHGKTAYILSYDTLRNDIDEFKKKHFNLIILDESQYIKNATAMKTKAVKLLDSKYRFSLTGTPIENGLSDLWSIFDFIMPGYLLDYDSFKEEYEEAFENDSQDEETRKKLISKITPFIFKRTKDQVLEELPGKTTTTVTISMTDKQQDIYSTYLRKTKLMLKNQENTTRFRIIQGILRLRQICVDPSSFLLNYDETPAKIVFTLDMIQDIFKKDSKVIIYSSFVTVLDRLAKIFKKDGVPFYSISGNTNAKERLRISKAFNEEDTVRVCLVSIKAGGTGLNLVGADNIIILDPWWNAAVEEQAADRAYRIGQKRPVTVYKLICHNSIEEKILKLQDKKKDLYDKLISGDTDKITGLTDEDIQYIFS